MYKVIKHFIDLHDNDHSYNEGDILVDFESRVLSQILQQHTAVPAEHRKDQKIRLH